MSKYTAGAWVFDYLPGDTIWVINRRSGSEKCEKCPCGHTHYIGTTTPWQVEGPFTVESVWLDREDNAEGWSPMVSLSTVESGDWPALDEIFATETEAQTECDRRNRPQAEKIDAV